MLFNLFSSSEGAPLPFRTLFRPHTSSFVPNKLAHTNFPSSSPSTLKHIFAVNSILKHEIFFYYASQTSNGTLLPLRRYWTFCILPLLNLSLLPPDWQFCAGLLTQTQISISASGRILPDMLLVDVAAVGCHHYIQRDSHSLSLGLPASHLGPSGVSAVHNTSPPLLPPPIHPPSLPGPPI